MKRLEKGVIWLLYVKWVRVYRGSRIGRKSNNVLPICPFFRCFFAPITSSTFLKRDTVGVNLLYYTAVDFTFTKDLGSSQGKLARVIQIGVQHVPWKWINIHNSELLFVLHIYIFLSGLEENCHFQQMYIVYG